MTEKKQILRSAAVITLATFTSRIFGYFRDQRIMLLLGTSPSADSFILAYRIPNLLRRLVGEGSLTASFIPVFTGYLATKPREEVWEFANRLFWTLALVLAGLTVLGVVFSPQVISVFTLFGGDRSRWELAVHLNRVIFPYLMFIGLSALAIAILNCFQVFGLPAATPILMSASVIVLSLGVVWQPLVRLLPPPFKDPAAILAAGVMIGGALQFLVQVPALVRRGMRFRFGISFRDPGVREVGRLMVPGFFGIGIAQVNFFVDTIFATSRRMPQGSVTSLYVADRVMEFALGAYAIAVATAILPMMSRQAAAEDFAALKKTFGFALRIVSFLTIPAAVGLIVLRQPILRVLFEHGRFSADSTLLTARALLYYAIGLPALAGIKLVVPVFYSARDTRTPVWVAAFALGLNIVLNTVFLRWFFDTFQNGSPALATAIAAYFNFCVLFVLFRLRFGRIGARQILASLARVGLASAAMGILCSAMLRYLHPETYRHFLPVLASMLGMIAVATAFYLALTWQMRCPELREVYEVVAQAERGPAGPPAMME